MYFEYLFYTSKNTFLEIFQLSQLYFNSLITQYTTVLVASQKLLVATYSTLREFRSTEYQYSTSTVTSSSRMFQLEYTCICTVTGTVQIQKSFAKIHVVMTRSALYTVQYIQTIRYWYLYYLTCACFVSLKPKLCTVA